MHIIYVITEDINLYLLSEMEVSNQEKDKQRKEMLAQHPDFLGYGTGREGWLPVLCVHGSTCM